MAHLLPLRRSGLKLRPDLMSSSAVQLDHLDQPFSIQCRRVIVLTLWTFGLLGGHRARIRSHLLAASSHGRRICGARSGDSVILIRHRWWYMPMFQWRLFVLNMFILIFSRKRLSSALSGILSCLLWLFVLWEQRSSDFGVDCLLRVCVCVFFDYGTAWFGCENRLEICWDTKSVDLLSANKYVAERLNHYSKHY